MSTTFGDCEGEKLGTYPGDAAQKGSFSLEWSQREEGHYQEDTPKSILEEEGNFQPASKVEESRALRFDQISFHVRQSEQTESQRANVRVELEDVKGAGIGVPKADSKILLSYIFHSCPLLWFGMFFRVGGYP